MCIAGGGWGGGGLFGEVKQHKAGVPGRGTECMKSGGEALKTVHFKGTVSLMAESNLIPSKVNTAQCTGKCKNSDSPASSSSSFSSILSER